jgi:SAM-dependent methyltransferase
VAQSPWKLQPANEQLLPALERWFDSEPGASILAGERALIEPALNNCFGYHLLQLSVSRELSLFANCRVQSRHRCHPLENNDTQCDFDQLPFATDSLDTVILHHAHEFVVNPHQMLREIQRVLVPHGKLVVIGFNPWSLLGLYSRVARRSRHSIWHNHLLSRRRLADWLSLLGFQINHIHCSLHWLPLKNHRLVGRLNADSMACWQLSRSFGSSYVISAVKEQVTMTPVKPRWQIPAKRFRSLTPVKPTASSGRHQHKRGGST